MFAFAIYDRYTKKLFCARDQTGVKPFLFVDHARYFSFASEEKAFFGIRHFSSSVRAEAVFDFFVSGKFGHEPEGFFEGIRELGAGHILIYDAEKGVVNIREYRDVSMPVPEPVLNTEESFRKLFFDAVEQHLQADVRVGACLSGGLDSSSIVAAISQIRGGRDQTPLFTASFPGEPFDETPFASEVAQKFGGDHHLIFPGPEGLAYELDDLIYSQDIPLWSTSTYAQHSVMRGVREAGIKVVLDGQGGDELLGGYHHHYYAYWRSLFLSGRLNRFFKEFRGTGSYLPAPSYLMRAFLQREIITKVPSGLLGFMMRSYHRDMRWLKPSFLSVFKERMQASEQFSDLPSMLDQDFFGWRLKGYLKCEDRAAMWHSVESRTPFADSPSLIKFCRSLDSGWKIRDGASKYILRHSMQGLVPSKVLDRRDKIGYATPNKAWIKAILPRAMEEIRYGGAEFFDFRQIERDFKESLTGENPHDTRIFKFISFGVWRRIFSV
jgi:asparagine synthase (glutamine-hydrolysing)